MRIFINNLQKQRRNKRNERFSLTIAYQTIQQSHEELLNYFNDIYEKVKKTLEIRILDNEKILAHLEENPDLYQVDEILGKSLPSTQIPYYYNIFQ